MRVASEKFQTVMNLDILDDETAKMAEFSFWGINKTNFRLDQLAGNEEK